jgi:hypothetical protein
VREWRGYRGFTVPASEDVKARGKNLSTTSSNVISALLQHLNIITPKIISQSKDCDHAQTGVFFF